MSERREIRECLSEPTAEIGFRFDRADFDRADVVDRRSLARIQLQVDRGGNPEQPRSHTGAECSS